jgi:hypothetical protein
MLLEKQVREGWEEGAYGTLSKASRKAWVSGWLDVEAPEQAGELLLRERLAGQGLHQFTAGHAEGPSCLECRLDVGEQLSGDADNSSAVSTVSSQRSIAQHSWHARADAELAAHLGDDRVEFADPNSDRFRGPLAAFRVIEWCQRREFDGSERNKTSASQRCMTFIMTGRSSTMPHPRGFC